jgi:Tol biopolymer transport system component
VAEVWIGDGPNLYRLSRAGALHSVPVDTAVGKVNGRVTAVRLSPEGSRVALVLTASDHTSQIYVGSVVRSSSDVRVANLTPVSPQGVAVRDVA